MKVGILGSGDVAKSRANGFLSRNHDVMLGPRDAAGGPPSMFVAGNDNGAKADVARLLQNFGWERVLYGILSGTWHHAFKLLR